MSIDNYIISIKPLHTFYYECLIKEKSQELTFGVVVQAPTPPTPPWVLHQFTTQPKAFFIDLVCEVIKEPLPVEEEPVADIPPPPTGSIEVTGSNTP